MSFYTERLCPCCQSLLGVPSIRSSPPAEELGFANLTPIWNGFFKKKSFFSYTRCQSCGLLVAPVYFDARQLELLYAQMPSNMDIVPVAALRQTQKGYFDFLRASGSLGGNYLEVGPDIGLFTENCVRDADFEKYWLFEPNRAVSAELAAVVGGKDHSIVHEMSDFSCVPKGTISCAVMIHVLDHLIDPLDFLRNLRVKLRADARLLIVTHDESSFLRRLLADKWPAFCLQHPQLFNRKSIDVLLRTAGFRVVTQAKTVNYFQLKFLARHLFFALGIRTTPRIPFGDQTIGLKLGNILTIAKPTGD